MPLALPWLQDRWERKLYARGGYRKRRSGRFTKPGSHPRATSLVPLEVSPPTPTEQVPARGTLYYPTWQWENYEPTGGWGYGETTASTVTYTTGTTAGTGIWLDGTTNGVWTWNTNDSTSTTTYGGDQWHNIYIPLGTQFVPADHPSPQLTPEQIAAIEKAERKAQFQSRIRAQLEGGDRPYNFYDKRHHADFTSVSQPEIVALQLLKKMLTHEEWRRYLRYGFIIVTSQVTGLDYQVFRGGGHIRVFRQGKKLGELCIHISDRKCPPTDRVIAKKIMLEATELDVWLKSNIHSCRDLGYRKPTINDLIKLGVGDQAHDVVGAGTAQHQACVQTQNQAHVQNFIIGPADVGVRLAI